MLSTDRARSFASFTSSAPRVTADVRPISELMRLAIRSFAATVLATLSFALFWATIAVVFSPKSQIQNHVYYYLVYGTFCTVAVIGQWMLLLWPIVIFPLFRSVMRPGRTIRTMIPVLGFLGGVIGLIVALTPEGRPRIGTLVGSPAVIALVGIFVGFSHVILGRSLKVSQQSLHTRDGSSQPAHL